MSENDRILERTEFAVAEVGGLLDKLEALLADATPEPWAPQSDGLSWDIWEMGAVPYPADPVIAELVRDRDVALIAELRNAAPFLLNVVRVAQKVNAAHLPSMFEHPRMTELRKALEPFAEGLSVGE